MLKKESIQKKIAFHSDAYIKALEKNDLDKAEFHNEELYSWEMLLLEYQNN